MSGGETGYVSSGESTCIEPVWNGKCRVELVCVGWIERVCVG